MSFETSVRGGGCARALAEAALRDRLLGLCNAFLELRNKRTIADDELKRDNPAFMLIETSLIAIALEKRRDFLATAS